MVTQLSQYAAVQDLFDQTSVKFGGSPAIDTGMRRITYRELQAEVDRLSQVLAAAGAGGLRGILYEVEPHDAATYAGVILLLMLASGAAACLPAWRAVRIDPAQLLR